jgi:hypothetical protein
MDKVFNQPITPTPQAPQNGAGNITPNNLGSVPAENQKPAKSKKKQTANKVAISFMAAWFRQYHKQVSIVVSVVLLVVGYLFFLGPKFSITRTIAGIEFQQSLEERSRLESELGYLAKLESSRSGISSGDIETIDSLLPSEPLTPQILTSLEGIARKSGAVIESIELTLFEDDEDEPSDDVGFIVPGNVSIVEISVAVESGPYSELKLFLENLEKNIRLMDVAAISYSPVGKSYNITMRAYYLRTL